MNNDWFFDIIELSYIKHDSMIYTFTLDLQSAYIHFEEIGLPLSITEYM